MEVPAVVRRIRDQVREDIARDPYLIYILLLSVVLFSFWIWHRLPNFATRDERWRVVDSMEVAGFVVEDGFSLESLQEGTAYWRPFGPTLYIYGLVTLPAILATVYIGDSGVFADLLHGLGIDFYAHWQALPAWLWWATVLPARLVNVALAVVCVYLLYRIGTVLRDRATGRLAALLLALTWGLIVLAHEAGEDVPALFCMLLVFYLAIRYVETGSRSTFLQASVVGGVGIAFKPTAGIAAVFLGVAFLLRARRAQDTRGALVRPLLLVGGPILAVVAIYLAYPSAVLNGPEILLERVDRLSSEKTRSHGWLQRPAWWWFVRSTVNGLGWPLAIASVIAVAASLPRLRERSLETDGVIIALSGLGAITAVFSTWAYFRTHHLLPTFPLVILLVALSLRRLEASERKFPLGNVDLDAKQAANVLAALLILSTAIYAGVGTLGYATQSRDKAVAWLDQRAGPNTTVETYAEDSQEAAVPHGVTIYRPTSGTDGLSRSGWMQNVERRCPDYIVLNYQRAMLWLAPDNHSQLSERWTHPGDAEYIRDLLRENGSYESPLAPYPYDVAASFGREPPFLEDGKPYDRTWNMIRAGIYPRTIQYGDPQDFGVYGYAVILERYGTCDR